MSNVINNSDISPTAKLFDNLRIVNSRIYEKAVIGDDCDVDNLIMYEKSEIGHRNLIRNSTIGVGSYTGTNTIIKSTNIGKYCSISWNVSIGGMNHPYDHISMYTDYWFKRTFGLSVKSNYQKSNETIIGNDVWIGAGACILEGIRVGNGCVIGAGAVVTKDVEPYSIIAGVPGKVVRKRFDDEIIFLLQSIKWWDWSENEIIKNIDLLRDKPNKEKLKKVLNI